MARRWLAALVALAAAAPLSAALAPVPARLDERASPELLWQDGGTAWMGLAPDDRRRARVSLNRLDPTLVRALVALEDQRFWWHPGVDPTAVLRATWGNLAAGRVTSGASTITMQVVRMTEPRPRTLRSKAIEAWRALGLEVRWSKRAILEAWLTFAPYGGNVEGVATASWALLGHGPETLSPDEIALLLAIPQDPTPLRPSPLHRDALTAARNRVAARLHHAGVFDDDALAAAVAAPVPDQLTPLPRAAPHAALAVLAQRPGVERAETTLDAGLTAVTQRVLDRVRARRVAEGIHNAAVLVVDLTNGAVRVALGGLADPGTAPGSFLPPFFAARSTGSALKPMIYGIALDRGVALPERLMPDIPRSWGGWRPENYERSFDGVVRLESALSRSLNVPFAELLQRVGADTLVGALQHAGADGLVATPGHYGLSAAVGGVELSPWDLAAVMTTVATDGRARPLSWDPTDLGGPGVAVLTPGAAWLTRRALRLRDRPDLPERAAVTGLPPQVAWKTGTSQGHHDAWAVGFDRRHLVVVWMGNLDRRPSFHLVGASAAGTVLFDVLEAIGVDPSDDPAPPDLAPVELCALSGHVPGPACPRRAVALAPVASVAPDPCPYHVTVEVDATTGLAVDADCRGDRATRTEPVLRWPSAVRMWLRDAGADVPEHPAWAPGCAPAADAPPRITHPSAGARVLLTPGLPLAAQQLPLEAEATRADDVLAWYVDGDLLGQARPGERVWWTPTPGRHEITVVDAAARAARRHVLVERAPGG